MSLPKAEDLAAVLAAIGDAGPKLQAAGFTRLRLGSLELTLAPKTRGERLVDDINKQAPLPAEPTVALNQPTAAELKDAGFQPTFDLQEAIANGARLVDQPTQA
jgi:hypothetical protein